MKKQIIKTGFVMLCLSFGIISMAQNGTEQAQPVKKGNTTLTAANNNTKLAPWEKQPIKHDAKKPSAASGSHSNITPAQAQPIQSK